MRRKPSPKTIFTRVFILSTIVFLLNCASLWAQQQPSQLPCPRLASVTPCGGKVGTTVEVTFSGTFTGFQFADMEEPQSLVFSHAGIKAEAIQPPPPTDPKAPKPPVTKFNVTIAPNVPPGMYDVRFVNKWGISNPRAFVVGDLNEVLEKEPNNDVGEAAQRVELNTTINGTIAQPTDVDYFIFKAMKGQRVVISCLASSIDSKLDSAIEIFNSANKKLAYNRLYNNYDSLADVVIPEDGDYMVRLFHFTHTLGTAEYFYRLTISTTPWIDAVFPAVVEPGKQTQVTVYGRNLPGGQPDPTAVVEGSVLEKVVVAVNAPNDPVALGSLAFSGAISPTMGPMAGFQYSTKNASGSSNPYPLFFARAAVVLDNDNNDTMETAQKVNLPCEIAGRFDRRRDRDWYSFTAKKGDIYNIELLSHRLGSASELRFILRNPAGTGSIITESQDNPDTLSLQFFARTNDPAIYRFTVPADGDYQLQVKNLNAELLYGPRQFYSVRISPDQPDFRLVVMPPAGNQPDACRLPQNGQQYFTVLAWRNDGFNGDINLTVEGLPQGVTCPPQTIAAGLRNATLVLIAAADAPIATASLKVKGTATIKGQAVTREARPASITWPVQPQQNIPTISRVDRELVLAVREPGPFNLAASVDKNVIQQGDKVNLTLKLTRISPDLKQALVVQTVDNLPGLPVSPLTINNGQPFNIAADKNEGTFVVEAKPTVPPGVYTIALKATVAGFPFTRDATKQPPTKANINVVLPASPVVLTVLPKTVATLAVTTPNPTVKIGMQTEVAIKATRQFDYAGELKVQVVIPQGVQGISIADAVIPAGQDEVKLIVKADPAAAAGARNDIVVRATAMLQGNVPAVQEVKFNVTVAK